jgi:uncharacterized phiE125 gp8 family phage protein
MGLALVTDVTEEPVSLDEQKAHLRLDTTDDDAYLAGCITAARVWVEGQTKRAILPQTWDYTIDYCWPVEGGFHRINLPLNPSKAISGTSPEVFSITYVDTNGVSQTLAQSQYTLVSRVHGSYIVPAYNITWPDVRDVPNAVTVRFVAGDADNIPQELHRAIMILAGYYYENRESGDGAPHAVEALISPHRKATFR